MLSVLVIDTSVIIDLHHGGLLKEVFSLPYRFVAPDVLIAEMRTPPGSALLALGLESVELSGEQMLEVGQLVEKYRKVSTNDIFAVVIAREHNTHLVTSDGPLRDVASLVGISVRGTLWILDELLRLNIVTPSFAIQSLEAMLVKGSRLPREECNARIRLWKRMETRK